MASKMESHLASCDESDCQASSNTDLRHIFGLQVGLMEHLRDAGKLETASWPLDISLKKSQQICRDTLLKAVEEMFEAVNELKNRKFHRTTELVEFDRDAFVMELIDSFHFQLEALIFVGVTPQEFADVYARKNAIVHKRIDEGY
jgi:hypothetical protein